MSDYINKVVSIILVFMMLVLAPLLISYKTEDMLSKRLILNEVTQFLDQVKDTGTISEDTLNQLYMACNSHGLAVDVTVKRLVATEVLMKDGSNTTKTTYFATDSSEALQSINEGDVIHVHVQEVGISSARKLTYSLLHIDEGIFEFSLAGVVG